MEQEFNRIYENLKPGLGRLEAKRLELRAKGIRTGVVAGGICLAIGCVITIWGECGWLGLIVFLIMSLIILLCCINAQSKELSAYYKKDIITVIISSLCENSIFNPEDGIRGQTFTGSGLFTTSPDRYHSEDMIQGRIGKTDFACSEIVAEEKRITTDSKGNRRESWVDIFRGFFFIADFQKDFKGQTIVYRNSWIKLWNNSQRVKLENPEFEKSFDVYSTDQIEARYLLTPVMMEMLMELDQKLPGKITVSFFASKVIIAIPDKTDHFEASIWKSQTNNNSLYQEFHTLFTLFHIVNDLNLNLRIWTKE